MLLSETAEGQHSAVENNALIIIKRASTWLARIRPGSSNSSIVNATTKTKIDRKLIEVVEGVFLLYAVDEPSVASFFYARKGAIFTIFPQIHLSWKETNFYHFVGKRLSKIDRKSIEAIKGVFYYMRLTSRELLPHFTRAKGRYVPYFPKYTCFGKSRTSTILLESAFPRHTRARCP